MTTLPQKIKAFYTNKKILVTGGTGSIGENLVSSLLLYNPKEIVVFSKDDSRQYLMKRNYSKYDNIHYFLGDIRDEDSLEYITRGIDIVFHTAAIKQVPICEDNPFEAVKTNVIGSENVIITSIKNKVQKVINISTDKAVNPKNTLGITKLLAEKLFYNANYLKNNKYTTFASVRFGNVIGSRGSVIPLILNQIKTGNEITITDPKMTRFYMTIPEATHLTLKAAYYSHGGETFIFKMKALELNSLIEAIRIYSKQKGLNVGTVNKIGVRPGEKMYEELISIEEVDNLVEDNELYVIKPENIKNYYHFKPAAIVPYNSDYVEKLEIKEIIKLIKQVEIE